MLNKLSDSTLKYTSVYILSEHTDISIELSDSSLTTFMHRSLLLLITSNSSWQEAEKRRRAGQDGSLKA